MKNKRIYFFMGTNAEFIKLAPIIKEFRRRKVQISIITSGQNRINFEELKDFTGKLKIDIAFAEKSNKSSVPLFLFWALKTFLTGLISLNKEFKGLNRGNSYFIVHGDTVSALIGSLIAKIFRLKLVHIESGLRSYNFFEPFPEEICRFINIHLADILFAPTDWAYSKIQHLSGEKINTKQNTLIESCLWALKTKKVNSLSLKERFGKYYILIMHRQEHVYFQKEWTRNILDLVINSAAKDQNCIFILHALTSRFLQSERLSSGAEAERRILMVPRLPYIDFINFMNKAEFIATDGCTNQEESYYMGLPMLALRNLTERIEGLGENVVISKGDEKTIKSFLKNYKKYKKPLVGLQVRPSKIIVDYLLK